MNLKDKACLVTGCASGIGKHMAGVLLRAGARVMATDVDAAGLAATVAALGGVGERLKSHALDVRHDRARGEQLCQLAQAQVGARAHHDKRVARAEAQRAAREALERVPHQQHRADRECEHHPGECSDQLWSPLNGSVIECGG